jgi:hypothetical protein
MAFFTRYLFHISQVYPDALRVGASVRIALRLA